jgi:hypothetical protein
MEQRLAPMELNVADCTLEPLQEQTGKKGAATSAVQLIYIRHHGREQQAWVMKSLCLQLVVCHAAHWASPSFGSWQRSYFWSERT